jgi:molybdate transport system ATP-binding protein
MPSDARNGAGLVSAPEVAVNGTKEGSSRAALHVHIQMTVGTFQVNAAFDAPPGVTVLFGPSGAGKSTILRAIAGLSRPRTGKVALGTSVWFDAERGIHVPPEARRLSLVFQSLALFPHLSALGNVAYGIDRRLSRDNRDRRALAMLARMKVAHVANRRPATFSGGEAQRVALARAFAREPRVLLLDEAFSAMDRDLRYELGADVRELVRELGIPAVLVTHHRMEARAVGDLAVLVREGRVDAIGPVRQVVPAPERERDSG